MSDTSNTDPAPSADEVSDLRKAAEGGKAAKAEAAQAKKELAFVKAGVATESKPAQALLASYDGELTEEAIRAEAKEWGLYADPSEENNEDPPDPSKKFDENSPEAQQQQLRDQSGGAPAPVTPPEKGGVDSALEEFENDRKAGFSQTDATNRAIGRVIKSAAEGDRQAVFDEEAWAVKQREAGHGAEYA